MQSRLRVLLEDGSAEELEANQVSVANDGSLVISHVSQSEQPDLQRGGKVLVQESRLLAVIRRDLWRRVETLELGDETVLQQVAAGGPVQ